MTDYSADGIVVHATDLNSMLKIDEIFTATGTTLGTGAKSSVRIKAIDVVSSTDANGDITVTYASAFPNGAGPVFAVNQYINTIYFSVGVDVSTISKTGCKVRLANASGAAITSSGPYRIGVFAFGG